MQVWKQTIQRNAEIRLPQCSGFSKSPGVWKQHDFYENDIVIFVLLTFGRDCYAFDASIGHTNLSKLVAAFEKRETATVGIPGGVYPDWVEPFKIGWIDGATPKAS